MSPASVSESWRRRLSVSVLVPAPPSKLPVTDGARLQRQLVVTAGRIAGCRPRTRRCGSVKITLPLALLPITGELLPRPGGDRCRNCRSSVGGAGHATGAARPGTRWRGGRIEVIGRPLMMVLLKPMMLIASARVMGPAIAADDGAHAHGQRVAGVELHRVGAGAVPLVGRVEAVDDRIILGWLAAP